MSGDAVPPRNVYEMKIDCNVTVIGSQNDFSVKLNCAGCVPRAATTVTMIFLFGIMNIWAQFFMRRFYYIFMVPTVISNDCFAKKNFNTKSLSWALFYLERVNKASAHLSGSAVYM